MNQKKCLLKLIISLGLLVLFIIMLKLVDVNIHQATSAKIGFFKINITVSNFFNYHARCDQVSDGILSLVIMTVAFNLFMIIKEFVSKRSLKALSKQKKTMLLVYVLVVMIYLMFEMIIINYRPILVDNQLEASFPSSHVMLTVVVCGLNMQLNRRKPLYYFYMILMVVMIIMRVISGVHWLTDIIGSIMIGHCLIMLYKCLILKKT